MKCLGLDPSLTSFGWALHDSSVQGMGRCVERGRFKTSPRTLFIDRYIDLREHLLRLVGRLDARRVGVEYPIFNATQSPGLYGLFLYTCEALRIRGCDVVFFSPGQAKAQARVVLGRPKSWKMLKPDMIEAARLDTGGGGKWISDEADAYWIAKNAARFWSFLDGETHEAELTPLECHQFLRIHTFTRGAKKGDTQMSGISYRENERFFRWSTGECSVVAQGCE